MCGRYTLTSPDELLHEFGFGELPFDLKPRYNIAPTQEAPVVVSEDGGTKLRLFRWGLVPAWSKDTKSAAKMINARSESVDQKPSFRDAFARRRCLVCCDGFYEWKREGRSRLPHYFRRDDGRPFAMAGIWESYSPPEGDVLHTFSVLTTEASDLMQPIHHRMPVLVAADDYQRWLDPAIRERAPLEDLLRPTSEGLVMSQVSELVNSVRNDSEACLRPGPDQQSLF